MQMSFMLLCSKIISTFTLYKALGYSWFILNVGLKFEYWISWLAKYYSKYELSDEDEPVISLTSLHLQWHSWTRPLSLECL